jgi:hypothetical protein
VTTNREGDAVDGIDTNNDPADAVRKEPGEPLLRYFDYQHLPHNTLRSTSANFANLAKVVVQELPRSAERTVALRKLLEAKDAAVRAAVDTLKGEVR